MYESSNYLILDDGRLYNSEVKVSNPRKIKLTLKEKIQTKFMNFIKDRKAKRIEKIDKKIEKQINKYEKEANKLQENADLITASPYLTENVPVVFKKIHYELDTIYGTIDKLTTLSSTLHEGDKPLRLIEKMFKAIKKNCSKTLSAAEQVNSLEELSQVNKEANPEEIVSSRENVQEMQPPVVEETPVVVRQRPVPTSDRIVRFTTPVSTELTASSDNVIDIPTQKESGNITSIESSSRFAVSNPSDIVVSSVEEAREQGIIVNSKLNAASQKYNDANQRLESAVSRAQQAQLELENTLLRVRDALIQKSKEAEKTNKAAEKVNNEASKYESTADQLSRKKEAAEKYLESIMSMNPDTELSNGRKAI